MKTFTPLFICLFLLANVSQATVRTVSNDPAGGSQYSSLQAAYNAAVNGDTLHLEGTNIPYRIDGCNQSWDKSLTVIGIGFNPQKQNPRRSQINITNCSPHFLISSGASGSKFYGIEFLKNGANTECVLFQGCCCINNITFENCKFYGLFNMNGYCNSGTIFKNCVFDLDNTYNVYFGTGTVVISNLLFTSCIFDGYLEGNGTPYSTLMIDHSLFLGPTFNNIYGVTVMNSVFMNNFPGGIGNSSFINNISAAAGTFPPVGLGSNTGLNNINATNPNFVTYTLGQKYLTTHDYHLQTGSAAIGTASDGTDIGLHGGLSKFSEQGEVLINPIMRSVMISNPSILPNGTLNVNINATKPDDN